VPVPAVGLGANWVNPHKAYDFGTSKHPWQSSYAGFTADWINAWNNINSQGPAGQSWTKYSTQVSGNGDFVLNLLADNCSWIYLDGSLVGFQGTADVGQHKTYPVHLNGTHILSFLIFDGGGSAGGEYRLETNTGTVYPTTTTVTFGSAPFVYTGSAFTATATVSVGSVIQSVTATITYSGDCVNAGTTCTATATYAGDATHTGSLATATITITYAICPAKTDKDNDRSASDDKGASKGVKSGSTIPVKVRVCDAIGQNVGSKSLQVKAVSISPNGTLDDSGKANPGNLFRFDDNTYLFNLKTKGLAAGAYTLDFTVGSDPTVYHFAFTVWQKGGRDR